MSGNIQYELQLQFLGLITGAGLMLSYDVLRVFRIFIPHHYIWVGIEDMIYWIYAALVTYTLLYRLNDGGIRGYVVAAALVGMIAYDRLISHFFLKILENSYKMLQKKLKYLRMKLSRHKKRRTGKAGD